MASLLMQQLRAHAARRPDTPAFIETGDPGRSISWGQLLRHAQAAGSHVQRGDVVMIQAGNSIEYIAALVGVLMRGGTALPVSIHMPAAELRALARESGATGAIGGAATLESLADLSVRRRLEEITNDAAGPCDAEWAGDGALLLQTSGTTGLPKLVQRPMSALDAVGLNCCRAIGIADADHMLACIPLTHSYGLDHGVCAALVAGCTVEMQRGFDPAAVLGALVSGRVTLLPGVPLMFDVLAESPGDTAALPRLRHAYSAGAPLPMGVYERFERRFGVRISGLYGSTEFASVTFADARDDGFDPASVGRAMEGVWLRIVDAHEPRIDRPLPSGCEGQVAVSAPSMFDAYIGAAGEMPVDGYFLSGDLGRLDAAGNLTITGRVKLLIEVGGLKVNPLEVEALLRGYPGVREAVVVPIAVTSTANRLKAVVVPAEGAALDPADLRRFCREHLSPHKVPRQFELRSDLPRSPTGKVLRKALECA